VVVESPGCTTFRALHYYYGCRIWQNRQDYKQLWPLEAASAGRLIFYGTGVAGERLCFHFHWLDVFATSADESDVLSFLVIEVTSADLLEKKDC